MRGNTYLAKSQSKVNGIVMATLKGKGIISD